MAVQNSSRKWMFIGGGVVAAVALVIGFQNYPPQPKDATGTIGAAQRYHEPQITGADVKVSQDELTTWIQSDTFDRIVKDPQARKLFTDAAVLQEFTNRGHLSLAPDTAADGSLIRNQRQVSTDALADPATKSGVMSLTTDPILKSIMENPALSAAINNQQFCKALLNDSLRAELVGNLHRLVLADDPK